MSRENTAENWAVNEGSCTLITSTKPSVVTKEFELDEDGKLTKKTSAQVIEGKIRTVGFSDLKGFAQLLEGLEHNQFLTYGIPVVAEATLVTESVWAKEGRPKHKLPRTKENFRWPSGPGILMLDYDAPKDGSPTLAREDLERALDQVTKGSFFLSDYIWWPSASSCIYHGERELTGIKGQRIYIMVADGSDVPRAGKALNAKLWALGYGRYEVSKAGSLLERGLFDQAVWQAHHPDFASGAKCHGALEQRRRKPVLFSGVFESLMDSRQSIPDLTAEEKRQADEHKATARAAVEGLAARTRAAWRDERVKSFVASYSNLDSQSAFQRATEVVNRAAERSELMGDWKLICKGEDGREITATVLDVLNNIERYHGMDTLDPLEPDYDGRRWVGKLFLYSARPTLHSFAHGGVSFRLTRQPARIEFVSGKGREATDALLDVLRRAPDVFDFGNELVSIGKSGAVCTMSEHSLRYHVGGLTQFWRYNKTPTDGKFELLLEPPTNVCKSVLALGSQRGLKALDAVITAPTLRPDGSVLCSPGYDAATRLLFEAEQLPQAIPSFPNREQAVAALEYLWRPFADFPFVGPLDRAVHLAALLTAAVRAGLPTAPAFGYDAPVQGSGKTLLARCIGVLATGEDVGVWPHTAGRDDEEVRKRIFTVLRSGSRAIIWDNVVGTFDSAAMASAITSPTFQDRILGASTSSSVPNRAMLILTGNNLTLAGEMPRRVLVARIDPATDKPFARQFDIDPYMACKIDRQAMISAALVLIRTYLSSESGPLGKGKLASFEQWDAWVRQTVIFANSLKPGMFGDVMEVVQANQAQDPEQEELEFLLTAWQGVFGSDYKTAHEILEALNNCLDSGESSANDLRGALQELCRGPLSSRSMGRALGYRVGRIVGGRRLEKKKGRTNVASWSVRSVV